MRRAVVALAALLLALPAFAAELMQPKDVHDLAVAGKVALVDVRTPQEWSETGIADVATPIDMTASDFVPKLKELIAANPDKRLAFICRSGNRSSHIVAALEQAGLKDLIDVAGGMGGKGDNPGWIASGLPVKTP
jgi:rhodanese-related sulfurtransferase